MTLLFTNRLQKSCYYIEAPELPRSIRVPLGRERKREGLGMREREWRREGAVRSVFPAGAY